MWDKHGTDDHHIIIGDNLSVMRDMPSESVDLIYADPPFNTGRDFGDYDDRWSTDDVYMGWLNARLVDMHRLLKPTGSIYLHCDQHMSHYIKVSMDRIWGRSRFRNEIVWHYAKGNGPSQDFRKKHDTILRYVKSKKFYFKMQMYPHLENQKYRFNKKDDNGRLYRTNHTYDKDGNLKRFYLDDGVKADDVWSFLREKKMDQLPHNSSETTGYPTQKPLALLHRIIKASSKEGDLVFDPFVGSGTTIEAAHQLGRRAIGIDINADTPAIVRVEGLKGRLV